ncbi:MAG: hypothetical protein F9K40_19180 [Kofleriaceae bacterium]|nr:MAG: hypothetical protein F9K40_19180 [Kofleriaceae bacterium]MBZ0117108.1 hypothetical protein [Sandaracinaceae bacterium]
MSGRPETPTPADQQQPDPVALPDEGDRELLDYLIERAWQEWLRTLGREPANDNKHINRAA